jgi:hypothetical protein
MASYSAFMNNERDEWNTLVDLKKGKYLEIFPQTPSEESSMMTTPSGSLSSGSLFTPPQVSTYEDESTPSADTLQSLVQMAIEQQQRMSSSDNMFLPPFHNSSHQPDYTAAAASLLNCLQQPKTSEGCHQVTSSNWSMYTSARQACPTVVRQSSSTSMSGASTSSNVMIQSLLTAPQVTVSSVAGKVLELATDRNGSRLLQKLLTQGGIDIVSRVIDEVENNLTVIMCDTYANYMCQQLFQAASAGQRLRLLKKLSLRFVEVARDRRGTHSLQALISHIATVEEEELLAQTLCGKIEMISLDVHATHVLQQAISCCLAKSNPKEKKALDFVFQEVGQSMDRLAVDPNALGVVKRCITHSQSRGYAKFLAEKIDCFMFIFVENPYANYAVQHALETWSASRDKAVVDLAEKLVSKLEDKIAPMALHKFASNVAEMAIKSSRIETRKALIESLHYDDDARMLSLMRSPFGVFVVGTAIKHAGDAKQSHALTLAVCRNLRKLPDGRNRNKWEKLLTECCSGSCFQNGPPHNILS